MLFETIRRKVLDYEGLQQVRANNPDKKIVFCTGCYDILQSGHAVFFNQCRALGDMLVVGVGRDSTIQALKGPSRPVNPENNRVYLVAALHEVDYATLNDSEVGAGKIDFAKVIRSLKPNIFVLNDDDSAIEEKKKLCDELGIEIRFVRREVPPELIPTSTTKIINKINYSVKAPLRIDFAGGWTDVPFIMGDKLGYVSNVAIKPLIEYKGGQFNFSGYPRGSGLSTSTAVKVLEMLDAKNYNAEAKSVNQIAEDLFNLENKELQWFIGRQDQYAIVYGGFNCFEFGKDYGKPLNLNISKNTLEAFRSKLLLMHTGVSRNAQSAVEQVYKNYNTPEGQKALATLAECGKTFGEALAAGKFEECAYIMNRNWAAQKLLADASTNDNLDAMYEYALQNGAIGGKICGAGGGGAFIFYCSDVQQLKRSLKTKFVDCFEIDFEFEYSNIKKLNQL